jgi:hypothetical protein
VLIDRKVLAAHAVSGKTGFEIRTASLPIDCAYIL